MRLRLNPASGVPIYLQLTEQIKHAIEVGSLEEGEQLPAIRTLAEELVVSPNTIVKAYNELDRDGVILLRHGAGAYVAHRESHASQNTHLKEASRLVGSVVKKLRGLGATEEEIRRLFEAELLDEIRTTR